MKIDTDSLFLNIGLFLDNNIGTHWRQLPIDEIKTIMRNISSIIEKNINENIYRDVQRKSYNSAEENFRIRFKQEMVAKTILFTSKKHYAMWLVDDDKTPVDKIKTVGLEIVRSDTPEMIRPMLKEIMEMILKGGSDKDIMSRISEHKQKLKNITPEDIAVNIGIHNTAKYIVKDKTVKGAPWHVKGLHNYRTMIRSMKLTRKYEMISDGTKVKCVYIKKNPYNMDTISFLIWPKEFDKIFQVDYEKMLDNFYISKIKMLLEPIGKIDLLNSDFKTGISLFFD